MSVDYETTFPSSARWFVEGAKLGGYSLRDVDRIETIYGPSEGFVYFITIGDPYPTHVKVGFTKGDPRDRQKSLQTGCPFPMKLLGYVFGTQIMERELHDVLRDERCQGEWFVFEGYCEQIVDQILSKWEL